jgi:hypothetical protein
MDVECLLFEAKIRFVPRTKHVEDLRPVVKEAILLEYSNGVLLALHDCNYELHVARERDEINRLVTAIEEHRGEGAERARHAERFISVFRRNERLEHHPKWPQRYYRDFFARLQRQAGAFRRCKWHINPALNRALHAIQRKQQAAAKRARMIEEREELIERNLEQSYIGCQYLRVLKFFGMCQEESRYVDSEKVMANYIATIHSLAREQRRAEDDKRAEKERRQREERRRKEKDTTVHLNSAKPKTAKRRTPEPAADPLLKKARQVITEYRQKQSDSKPTTPVRKSTAPIRLQRPTQTRAHISPRKRAEAIVKPAPKPTPAPKPVVQQPPTVKPAAERFPSYLVLPDEKLENKICQIRPTTFDRASNGGIRMYPSDFFTNAWDRFFIKTKDLKDDWAMGYVVPKAIKFVHRRVTWTNDTVDLVAINDNEACLIRRIVNVYGRQQEQEESRMEIAMDIQVPEEEDPAIIENMIVALQNDDEFTLRGKPRDTRVTLPLTAQQRAEKEELAIDVELANLSIVDEMEVGAEEVVTTTGEQDPLIDDVLLLHHSFDFGEPEEQEVPQEATNASTLSLTTRHLEIADSAVGSSTASTNPFAAGADEEEYWETVTTIDWRKIAEARKQGDEKAKKLYDLLKEMDK